MKHRNTIIEYQELDQQRPTWGDVLRNMPPGMATSMETITAREKTKTILTAFGTRYCSEWTDVYAFPNLFTECTCIGKKNTIALSMISTKVRKFTKCTSILMHGVEWLCSSNNGGGHVK